jgi:gamma-glutamylaminecyclotransferase
VAKHLVFVYGTLKRKEGAWEYYLMRQNFIGEAVSVRPYAMYDTGGFPVLSTGGGVTLPVRGELYEVDDETLDRLDSYEGNGHMFQRQIEPFYEAGGERVEAQVYFGMSEYWDFSRFRAAPVNEQNQFQWSRHAPQTP